MRSLSWKDKTEQKAWVYTGNISKLLSYKELSLSENNFNWYLKQLMLRNLKLYRSFRQQHIFSGTNKIKMF